MRKKKPLGRGYKFIVEKKMLDKKAKKKEFEKEKYE